MRHENVKLTVILLLGLGLARIHAQESVPASGGDASGSGGKVAYSVGQTVYGFYAGSNGSELQGVQQPYEISVVTTQPHSQGISLKCSAYPNPVKDFLILKFESRNADNLSYQLFDLNGNILDSKIIQGIETSFSMESLKPATYLLKVFQNNKEIEIFKIIKN